MDMNMNDNNNMKTLPKRGLKTRSYNVDMNKKDLKRLSKLHNKPIPSPRTGKWENMKPKPIP